MYVKAHVPKALKTELQIYMASQKSPLSEILYKLVTSDSRYVKASQTLHLTHVIKCLNKYRSVIIPD